MRWEGSNISMFWHSLTKLLHFPEKFCICSQYICAGNTKVGGKTVFQCFCENAIILWENAKAIKYNFPTYLIFFASPFPFRASVFQDDSLCLNDQLFVKLVISNSLVGNVSLCKHLWKHFFLKMIWTTESLSLNVKY